MKNIMIISRALTYGGAERVAASLASYLAEHYNVILVVIDGDNPSYDTSANTIFLNQSVLNKGHGIMRVVWFLKLFLEVLNIRRANLIDCTISFLTEPELMNALTSGRGKSITSIRNVRSSVVKGKIKKIRDKWVFSKMNTIVSLSENAKKDLILNYNVRDEKIRVIYNICDREQINKQIEAGHIDEEDRCWFEEGKTFITTGRLSSQKAQWHMIRAFSYIAKKYPDVKLVILGQGEEEYLNDLIKRYEIVGNIKLLGFKKNPYVYLNRSYCFLFSSVFEGLGNSIVEAMACGLPIISTDCNAGPRELLAPKTDFSSKASALEYAEYGILTPVCDGIKYTALDPLSVEELELCRAIEEMVVNKELHEHYRIKAIERGAQFSKENIIDQWIKAIEE